MSPAQGIEFEIRSSAKPTSASKRAELLAAPGFGAVFTDHMATIRWTEDAGWHGARIEPYAPVTLDPAAAVFHYGQEIFEGLKAYAQPDGSVVAFRPEANAARFNRSAVRLAMPELPEATFVRALELLVTEDRDWVPTADGHSLYLRPFMIATQRGLGVNNPSSSYLFTVIASPVAGYFGGEVHPVTVWLSEDYTRAAPGGTGEAKCGGNYAAAFAGQQQALDNDCDQVVWLDAAERRWVEEMGGMNLFFVYGSRADARIMTPAATGSLLQGVTRDSLLKLGPDLGIPAYEGKISVGEWQAGCASGEITEVFACGTAAVITPVGAVRAADGGWTIGDGGAGPVTMRLRRELVGIQYGSKPDRYGWLRRLA
jgi:branched-chain amino acid aminotransferase